MSNEELCGQEVSKVDSVLTSLYNDEVSKLGNSAVQSQGREIPKMIFCWGDYHNAVIKFYSNISLYSLLITVNAQVTSGGKVPTKPRGCNRSHIPKVLEHSSGLPNPQPSHEPPFPRPPPPLCQAPYGHLSHLGLIQLSGKKKKLLQKGVGVK